MERIVDIIRPLKVRQGGPVGPQHVIRHFEEIKADGFRRLGPIADSHAICRHVASWKKGTELKTHGLPFISGMMPYLCCCVSSDAKSHWAFVIHRIYGGCKRWIAASYRVVPG